MKELGQFQRYLIEEFVEDWREGQMSRRDMVRRTAYVTGGVASAATVLVSMGCGPAATPTPVPTKPAAAPPTTAPAAAAPTTAPAATKPAAAAATTAPTSAPTAAATTAAAATKPAAATGAASPAAAGASPAATGAASPAAAGAATKPAAGATGAASPAAGATGASGTPAAAPAAPATPTGARSPLAVKADDPAIEVKKVEFPGEAGPVLGYLARPKAAGSYAGIIVIHENRGLNEHTMDVVRRAAKEGMIALGVDLVSRGGGTEKVADDARVGGILGQAKPEDFVADLSSGVKFVQTQDGIKKDKIGAIGFCFGGGYTWRLAVMNKEIKSATPFYGPAPPLELVPNTNAAILGIYAGLDQRINASMPPLEEALKKAGKTYEMKVYPEVNHGFHNDTGAAWNEKAAVDAWQTAMAWHKKNLA